MRRGLLAGMVCSFLLLGACGTGESPVLEGPSPSATNEAQASTQMSVDITHPEDGSTVEAGDVEVMATTENFEVVDKVGEDPVDGEGHLHFYLDEESNYKPATTTSYTWPDVEAGEHTFGVELRNNDHSPLDPPIKAEVTVTVE